VFCIYIDIAEGVFELNASPVFVSILGSAFLFKSIISQRNL
jgi:hypothetical protein